MKRGDRGGPKPETQANSLWEETKQKKFAGDPKSKKDHAPLQRRRKKIKKLLVRDQIQLGRG